MEWQLNAGKTHTLFLPEDLKDDTVSSQGVYSGITQRAKANTFSDGLW